MKKRQGKKKKKRNFKHDRKKVLIFDDVMIANCLICGVASAQCYPGVSCLCPQSS